MKILAQNYRTGELTLVDAPAPACRPGGVIVRSEYSLISAGTELMKVGESKLSLVGKARARPDQVQQVMNSVRQQGMVATYRKVSNRLDSLTPLGYSLCGRVEEVGAGLDGYQIGDRVACGGNKYALHAEFNWVPANLCVPVADGIPPEQASFTTVGAIAMQAFRQSESRMGETSCVIGLGLLGQILVQLLGAAGIRVVGIDLAAERCRLAEQMGAVVCDLGSESGLRRVRAALDRLTDGAGADAVFLAAGGDSNEPVELAAKLARDRARIVDVGKTRLDLPWKEYYEKELELRFSRSYGPGRYDPNYEERGIDYPIGYVRWTERRNMQCFIDLLAEEKLNLEPLISNIFPFDEAPDVLEGMNRGDIRGIGVLFRYAPEAEPTREVSGFAAGDGGHPGSDKRTHPDPTASGIVRIGAIGCGNYGSTMLLPHLKERRDVALVEIATRTALSAVNAVQKHGFTRMATDHTILLEADDLDAVLILTRHGSHARLVCDALRAGKTVFVEKPLAVRESELQAIERVVQETGNDRIMVGFNRRFAPLLVDLHHAWGDVTGPQVVQYRVNAGPLATDSWYAEAAEHGSRFVGEGCHFVDTLSWWVGCDPIEVSATAATDDPDNLTAVYRYPDGSLGTIAYLTQGDPRYPKERMEVMAQGAVASLENFSRTELWRNGKARRKRALSGTDKGQAAEMAAFVQAVRDGSPMPVSFTSLVATTRATFVTEASVLAGRALPIAPPPDPS